MSSGFYHIEERNLSVAWTRACAHLSQKGNREVQPLVVTLTGFENGLPIEISQARTIIDQELARCKCHSCHTTANTVFPRYMWNRQRPAQDLYDRYLRIFPEIKKQSTANAYGTYFQRLIAFGKDDNRVNQLKHIIDTYSRGNHRRSALQASIFNPLTDHTHQRQRGFPCLQQVTFAIDSENGLSITGLYDLQYVFARGYGNYLGLSHLGLFMAHQLQCELRRMTCVASIATLGKITMGSVRELVRTLGPIVEALE